MANGFTLVLKPYRLEDHCNWERLQLQKGYKGKWGTEKHARLPISTTWECKSTEMKMMFKMMTRMKIMTMTATPTMMMMMMMMMGAIAYDKDDTDRFEEF